MLQNAAKCCNLQQHTVRISDTTNRLLRASADVYPRLSRPPPLMAPGRPGPALTFIPSPSFSGARAWVYSAGRVASAQTYNSQAATREYALGLCSKAGGIQGSILARLPAYLCAFCERKQYHNSSTVIKEKLLLFLVKERLVRAYITAITNLWREQKALGINSHPSPRVDSVREYLRDTLLDGYTEDEFKRLCSELWTHSADASLSLATVECHFRTLVNLMLGHYMLTRGGDRCSAEILDLKLILCMLSSLAFYLLYCWDLGDKPFPDFTRAIVQQPSPITPSATSLLLYLRECSSTGRTPPSLRTSTRLLTQRQLLNKQRIRELKRELKEELNHPYVPPGGVAGAGRHTAAAPPSLADVDSSRYTSAQASIAPTPSARSPSPSPLPAALELAPELEPAPKHRMCRATVGLQGQPSIAKLDRRWGNKTSKEAAMWQVSQQQQQQRVLLDQLCKHLRVAQKESNRP
ncbi:uncharacterized protein BDR25DRAFT_363348 [Lindgomyces ingoldianus]|uniref:Uncharacterized protein n=1 Tax=Lindgomyces ingoldianus TaxID=673940 RepID=A0ACB6Q7S9_9PLEO|nr:uncharacterized protein BDR25DRAFT_363348 [Lindgomyces ingoldianus]KAF2462934.1 hypothetical protein BDR25DRAFT_363348 [Lindgomyces ingoldianus]